MDDLAFCFYFSIRCCLLLCVEKVPPCFCFGRGWSWSKLAADVVVIVIPSFLPETKNSLFTSKRGLGTLSFYFHGDVECLLYLVVLFFLVVDFYIPLVPLGSFCT